MGESIWRIATVSIALTILLIAAPATAQRSQNWRWCEDTVSSDVAIGGCTAVIQSGNENQANMARAFHLRAVAYDVKGTLDLAISDYIESIRLDPTIAVVYADLGIAYIKKRNFDAAIANCDEAIRLDRRLSTAFTCRATAYVEKSDYDRAIVDYDEAIRLDPRDAFAFNGRGVAYHRKRNHDLAIADFSEAIRLELHLSTFFSNRGNSYGEKSDYDRAIADYNEAIRLEPRNVEAFGGRGAAYYGQKKYDLAIADYDMAIRLDSTFRLAFLGRGNAHKIKGERALALADYDEAIRLELNPTINVVFPSGFLPPDIETRRGVQFAFPPLPDEAQLRQCKSQNQNRGDVDFYQCVIGQAFPNEYRITRECFNGNRQDRGRALLCTTQQQNLLDSYDKFRSVQQCATAGGNNIRDNWTIAQCLGRQVLGQEEQYYLGCVTANKGDLKTAAVCAVARDLTPEQQIALSCAIAGTGGPQAYAACVGGQLLKRELEKCWTKGIHTEGGCFGPNNEYVKFINNIDAEAQRIMGPDSEAYRAWKLWKDNVLAPGPNGEVVKFFNNGIKDLREGPGENNEVVKFGNSVGDAINSLGNSFGF